ncbi:Spectrin beta chain [Hypsibius exemplaris]|uniref:Spectrin beta chain n=1 Tax=Hypsibius exemplaris TaxID=2072580 RepID=A0A1W0WRL1_HYPEX|nr:Spectrin beta chain [Hypsibius exemplaris]
MAEVINSNGTRDMTRVQEAVMDRIVQKYKDERENVQKKTFTKWVNSHLIRVGCRIGDLYTDLRDGKMILKLLEVLSGERLPKPTRGKMRIHCLENVDKALQFLKEQHVHLENLGSHDIVDGNQRLTLGLIWTIILRFQIQDIIVEEIESKETRQAKDALLLWCQMKTAGYPNVNVRNFTTSWKDGLAFNALIHRHREDLIQYEKLNKSQAIYNLNNAFNVAEQKLGLAKLIDAEDVAVEYPDEKSIITYVVTYYHFFSKMRADTVHGRRIGKIVDVAREADKEAFNYERLTTDLLQWIRKTIESLNDRHFANSLPGVQQQLGQFNTYRTVEKPPKFVEKGNLEMMLFAIQSKLRAHDLRAYVPPQGKLIADINKGWESLERAEHERELALREELIRQEKLEQLASRFDRKAGMRETWLSENQRLVAQDNFGTDLGSVDAASKKHEAIETDIFAYEERVQAVISVAEELEQENYHDIQRINTRKDNVLRLWNYLLELLRARRQRLDVSLEVHKTFLEMLLVAAAMEDLKIRLVSDDYGRHLLDVEELIQKHSLLDNDIAVIGDRVKAVNNTARRFIDDEGLGFHPVDPHLVIDRMQNLEDMYAELVELSQERKDRLDDSRQLWQFFADIAEEEAWIREKEQMLSSADIGRDLTSINLLLTKQKLVEDDLNARKAHLLDVIKSGEDLVSDGHFGAEQIQARISDVNDRWEHLMELSAYRKKRLLEAVDYHQFFTDADDTDTWMLDTLRLVSSDDIGRDEGHVQSLLKKHQDVLESLQRYEPTIRGLQEQASNLGDQDKNSPEVRERLNNIAHRYDELLRLAEVRKQRLLDALDFFKLLTDVDATEQLINEKERMLATMGPTQDMEEVEVMKHRFGSLENEMGLINDRVKGINDVSERLLSVQHPDAREIHSRRNRLNSSWNALVDNVNSKRDELEKSRGYQTFRIECQETTRWIEEKIRIIEDSEDIQGDLGGLMKLQRRLSFIERDMGPIRAKMDSMLEEAHKIERERPEEAAAIRERVAIMKSQWERLNQLMGEQDEKLGEAGELQHFLRDLDVFQGWLTRTQVAIASQELPEDLAETEKALNAHKQLKEEIDNYFPDYTKLMETGQLVTKDQQDPQYILLRERLKGLKEGWEELQKMWENRQQLLAQSLNYQVFLRDAKQCEVLLGQQENFLARDETPRNLEDAENMLKRHDDFLTSLEVNQDRVQQIKTQSERLTADGNYASDRIFRKAENIMERYAANRERANSIGQKLRDARQLQQYLRDVEEHLEFINNKRIQVEDENYRSAKTAHQKWTRHQAFEAEVAANRAKMDELRAEGEALMREKPQFTPEIRRSLEEINTRWQELEDVTRGKGERLFDANRQAIYEQTCDDVDNWVTELETQILTTETGQDLTTVNILMQKQQVLENQLQMRAAQVSELERHEEKLEEIVPEKMEELKDRRHVVEEKFRKLQRPIEERRRELEKKKEAFQFLRDIDDEKFYIHQKMTQAISPNVGNDLFEVLRMKKQNNNLRHEIENHEPRIRAIVAAGNGLMRDGHPDSARFQELLQDLEARWRDLKDAIDDRDKRLDLSEKAQQYFSNAAEAEQWMSEQELYLLSDDRPKDEATAQANLKKQEATEIAVREYAEKMRLLSEQADRLLKDGNPFANQVRQREERLEKAYAGLKDLSTEGRNRVADTMQMFLLQRDIDDLERWIAEKEVVANSHELGTDFDHVTILRERFDRFCEETEAIGVDRVRQANEEANALIRAGHTDAPLIAQWKDRINEAWENLRELMETRKQLLNASYELHKYFWDCKDLLSRIHEKQNSVSDDLGRDSGTISAHQRKHASFQQDLIPLGQQVEGIQERATKLLNAYAGDRAREIQVREAEVVNAWRQLNQMVDVRRQKLSDTGDLFRFFNMVRDLMLWMDDVSRQMNTSERARDVSGVELLMNNHQSLRAEVDARDSSFAECIELGKDLLARNHYASPEVKDKLLLLTNTRGGMMNRWDERWEHLQLILEVYQFARDAAVAEAWLIAQEPYLFSQELGHSVQEVERMIKKHESFEKSAAAQDERFQALHHLTRLELKEMARRRQTDDERRRSEQRRIEELRGGIAASPGRGGSGSPGQGPARGSPGTPGSGGRVLGVTEVEGPLSPERVRQPGSATSPGTSRGVTSPGQAGTLPSGPGSDEGLLLEGPLDRKHDLGPNGSKAKDRSWLSLYAVVRGSRIFIYRNEVAYKADSAKTYHGEEPIELSGSDVAKFEHHAKKHAFQLTLADGSRYLFDARNDEETNIWMENIRSVSGEASPEARSSTLPEMSKSEAKRGSLPWRKKKPKRSRLASSRLASSPVPAPDATASGWIGDPSGVFDVPCAVEHDMGVSVMATQLSLSEGCNRVGKFIKPSVNKKNQITGAHKNDGHLPIHIHFKYRLTESLEGVWSTILHGTTLYVHIPTNTNGEGSKDSFIRLLEYAEEKLKATNVVVFFQEDRSDAPSWMRAFLFLGFSLLPPKHHLRPDNQGFIYMMYVVD